MMGKKGKRKKRRKRADGEGTIFWREDRQRWVTEIPIGVNPETGKTKYKTLYGKTQEEILEKKKKLELEMGMGLQVEAKTVTFGEWLVLWLTTYKKNSVRPSTYNNYEMIVQQYLKPNLGHIPLRELQTNQLQQLFNWLFREGRQVKREGQDPGLSRRTVELTRTTAKAALEQAVQEGLLVRNPAVGTTLPKEERKEVEPFTKDEVIRFLDSIKEDRLYAAYYLMVMTGLRRGECLGLKWKDLDLEEGRLHVKRSLVEYTDIETGKVVRDFQNPKTSGSRRTIPLIPEVVAVLKTHKARQNEEKLLLGKEYNDEDLVFCIENGRRIWPRNFNRQYTEHLKKAGIPHKKLHALRHTFVTLLLEAGEDLKNIQELVGHSTITVTADIYASVLEQTKKKAVEKLGDILTTRTTEG